MTRCGPWWRGCSSCALAPSGSAAVSLASSQGPRRAVRAVARGSFRRGYPNWNYRPHRAAPDEARLRHNHLRAGVSLPALMKLLGHRTANMTLRYVQITQQDLQREFHLARQHPRHFIPLPAALSVAGPGAADASLVLDRIQATMRVLDLYRQQNPAADPRQLTLLARRLLRIRAIFRKVSSVLTPEK